MSHTLKCTVGSEPGGVTVTTINVDVVNGRLHTASKFIVQEFVAGEELALLCHERIRGWGKVDSAVAYLVRSVYSESIEVCIPDHEFSRIGFDPKTLRRFDCFEMGYKSDPVYHANGVPG